MKPTRMCDWPPRLDVTLRPSRRTWRRLRSRRRRAGHLHPVMLAVAQRRWPGRPARQRRFEHLQRILLA
ncbi:MAG TPA: hypothetical protein VMB76_00980 [Casimicrobiaceae bacterium]|jgi:hypothetical protein|nr:hypothetical protein [Casimicrobiaceae bacterium]